MPTESYTIHIPHESISKHNCGIHSMPEGPMNQTLLRLLTCEELYALWSTELRATNVFLELELLTHEKEPKREFLKLYPKEVIGQLPISCKNIHLHLLHINEKEKTDLSCCKNLVIHQDGSFCDTEPENANEEMCPKEQHHISGWWETDIIVRGFRPSKHNLWSNSS